MSQETAMMRMRQQHRGECAHCGHECAVNKDGTPRSHGERRVNSGGEYALPGTCRGVNELATPLPAEPLPAPVVPDFVAPPVAPPEVVDDGLLPKQVFELLCAIDKRRVYISDKRIAVLRGHRHDLPVPKTDLAPIVDNIWAVLASGVYRLTDAGSLAMARHWEAVTHPASHRELLKQLEAERHGESR